MREAAGLLGIQALQKHWWALLLRGIVAIIFGILCFYETGATIFALVILIGAFFFVDGAFTFAGALRSSRTARGSHWWLLLAGGLVGILAGILTFLWPAITAFTLALLVSAWALVTGILELVAAIWLRAAIPHDWLWVLNGLFSILVGVLIAIFPGAGLVALTYLLGFYALIAGFTMIGLSIRLKTLPRQGG